MSTIAGLATAAVGLSGSAAWADSTTALPISHYAHMLVDPAHQHIFFSQGSGSTSILVTDLSGAVVASIPNEPGADGLALSADGSTVYAALADGSAIAAIDTASLTETDRTATGSGSRPGSLAIGGGQLWYGYTDGGSGGIGSVDISSADPVATAQPTMAHWTVAPLLAADADTLAAAEPAQGLSYVATFDLSSGTPVLEAEASVSSGTSAVQFTPDGSDVVLAAQQDAAVRAFRTSDLSPTAAVPGVYYSGGVNSEPNSLAIGADGTVAVGNGLGTGPNVFLYSGSNTAMSSFAFAPSSLAPDGLAWGADGLTLYAVTTDSSGAYTLNVLPEAELTDTQLSLKEPNFAVPTQPFTFGGSLATKGVIPVGSALQVSRDGTALPDATVAADGSFTVTDTQQNEGAYTYQVSYAGDATHRPSTASLVVNVSRLPTGIFASSAASSTPASVTLAGTLSTSRGLGSIAPGTTIQVIRTNVYTRQSVTLPPVPVDPATGAFTVTDALGDVGLGFSYDLSFAGDATLEASTANVSLQLSKEDPELNLSAPKTSARAAALKFSGRLSTGPYPAGETVAVTRTDLAHPSGYSLGSAVVGADGAFSVADTPQIGGANTYTVTYAGDLTHNSASASTTVQVSRAATALSVATNASTYTYGAWTRITVHLGTTDNGRTVSVYAQPVGGARVLVTTGTVGGNGDLVAWYRLAHTTWISASFAGDYRYAPAALGRYVYDQAEVAEAQSGYYAGTELSGVAYKVYHHTAAINVGVAVAPDKAGQCVYIGVQEYYSGGWHAILSSSCQKLGQASDLAGRLVLKNATGHLFRFVAEYVRSASDTSNLNTWGTWQYFTVRT